MRSVARRFDTSVFPENHPIRSMERVARSLCSFVASRELTRDAEIHFGFLEDFKVQAVARADGSGYIGVSIGAVALFLDVFGRLLSDRTFLADIGHASLEAESTSQTYIPMNAENIDWQGPTPKCRIRQRASVELAFLAFQFLVSHEVTHIQQGHIGLVQSRNGRSSICEGVTDDQPLSMTMQALELLADFHGAARVLRRSVGFSQEKRFESLPGKTDRKALKAIYGSPILSTYFVMFSIAMAWRIFDEQYWDLDRLKYRSHPPIPVRQLALTHSVRSLLQFEPGFGVPQAVVERILVKAQTDAEVGYLKITGQEKTLRAYEALFEGQPTFAHLQNITAIVGALQNQLAPFTWGEPGRQIRQ